MMSIWLKSDILSSNLKPDRINLILLELIYENFEIKNQPLTNTGENEAKCRVNFRLGAESYSSLGRGGNSSRHFGTNSPVDIFRVLACIG